MKTDFRGLSFVSFIFSSSSSSSSFLFNSTYLCLVGCSERARNAELEDVQRDNVSRDFHSN